MPSYTYNENIPNGPNNPSTDQPDMYTNTNSIFELLGGDATVDMIGFGDSNGGWHRKVTYVNQGSNPGSSAGQYVVYSKMTAGQSELFAQKDATSSPIQLTNQVPNAASSGFSYLPGGMLIQWVSLSTTGSFNWPTAFASACYGATLGYNNAASGTVPNLTSITTTTAVLSNSGTAVVFVIAIGV
jgi:hypothetical protein